MLLVLFVILILATPTKQQSGSEGTPSADGICATDEDCGFHSDCDLSNGVGFCKCKPGFARKENHCRDVDECNNFTKACDGNATCENTVGLFLCTCLIGFTGNGSVCYEMISDDDYDCHKDASLCHPDAICEFQEITGVYECICGSGFSGNGFWCEVSSKDDSTHISLALITLLIIPLTLAAGLVKYIKMRRLKSSQEHADTMEMTEIGNSTDQDHEIPLTDLESIFLDGTNITQEFKELHRFSKNTKIPAHRKKQSEVFNKLLQRGIYPNELSFVKARWENKGVLFLATQNPRENSIPHFLSMIWERKVNAIVLIEYQLREKSKCSSYWANSKLSHNGITAQMTREINRGCFVERTLQLNKDGKILQVVQFHIAIWPDHGVPKTTSTVIEVCDILAGRRDDVVLVHCSNGYGRTGTFIALCTLLNDLKAAEKINIFHVVKNLRNHRPFMVENLTQYKFLYKVILERVVCGITSKKIQSFSEHCHDLERNFDGKDGYLQQFQILQSVSRAWQFNDGKRNIHEFGTGYGTTPVRVHFLTDTCIVASDPNEQTLKGYYEAILKSQATDIVVLSTNRNASPSVQNWLDDIGDIELHWKSDIFPNYIKREITFVKKGKEILQSRHFQYTNWFENGCPGDESNFMNFISGIEEVRRKRKSRAIFIHSNDLSKCIVFCGLYNLLRIVHHESAVDVFRTFKDIQDQTQNDAVLNEAQYRFCYSALASHLTGARH